MVVLSLTFGCQFTVSNYFCLWSHEECWEEYCNPELRTGGRIHIPHPRDGACKVYHRDFRVLLCFYKIRFFMMFLGIKLCVITYGGRL